MSSATDLVAAASITNIWTALGGAPLRHGRGRAFWRDGDGYNVSLSDDKGAWHDFATGEGGGVLDLVQRVLGGSRKAAAAWLAEIQGQTLDGPRSDQGRRTQRALLPDLAVNIEHWRNALTAELEDDKRDALTHGDWFGLAHASAWLHRIQNGAPESIIAEFQTMQTADPKRAENLIEAGRQDWTHAGRVCALIVTMLAQAQLEAVGDAA